MAVYQGARLASGRLRPAGLPSRSLEGRASEPAITTRRASPRPATSRPAGVIMGVILGLTMLGLVYLTQTLGANAMSAQIDKLRAEQAKQVRTLTNQQAAIQLEADPANIAQRAERADLKRLGDAIVLRAP